MDTGASTGLSPSYESKNKEEEDIVIDDSTVKLAKFTKIIAPIFLVFGLFALICTILSIAGVGSGDGWVMFIMVLLGTIVFSIIAALGVYKWGTVEEQIELFKEENSKYEHEIDELRQTREQLGSEVTKLQETTRSLERDVDNLKQTLSQYDELKESLTKIAGDNKHLNDLINDVNDMYNNMKNTILSNTRAGILSAYYDAALRDEEEGMTQKEYKRFLARLDKKTRGVFQSFGSFDQISGDDHIIDLNEFQKLVDRLLTEQADDLILEQEEKSKK